MKSLFMCISMVLLTPSMASSLDPAKVQLSVEVEVIDERGKPLHDVELEFYFTHTGMQRHATGDRTKVFYSVFDGNSKTLISYESYGSVALRAKKGGFWPSFFRYDFTELDRTDVQDGSPNGHYKKEFTIVLRKKQNPRPLFVHKTKYHTTQIFDTPMGYDFEIGDLVHPFGQGKVSDVVLTLHQDFKEGRAYLHRLEMTFPNPNDGIIAVHKKPGSESLLLLGAQAPDEGYVSELSFTKGIEKRGAEIWRVQEPSKDEIDDIEGYWFRTRSEEGPDTGKIKARYGKIKGPITVLVDDLGGAFYFTYYFSPDLSRSLEWNGESLVPNANLQSVKER